MQPKALIVDGIPTGNGFVTAKVEAAVHQPCVWYIEVRSLGLKHFIGTTSAGGKSKKSVAQGADIRA